MSTGTVIGQQDRTLLSRATARDRLAGLGGLVFAATLLAQNIIRAGGPGFGAPPAQVSAYFLHHRAARPHPARPVPG